MTQHARVWPRWTAAIAIALAAVLSAPTAATAVAPVVVQTAAVQAAAKPKALTARVAFGDNSFTAAWSAVTGAKRYEVRYATNSSLKKAKKVTVSASARHRFVKGLKNKKTYWLQVRALDSKGKVLSKSKTLKARPEAGYPRQLKVKVVPEGANSVRVSWTGQGRATKVAVIAGSESSLATHTFSTKWYPATTTSVVVKVPAKLQRYLGAGTGNPIFVKVAVYNDDKATSAKPLTRNEKKAYRLSLAGPYTWVAPKKAKGTPLSFGFWNVNSIAATNSFAGYTWKDRRGKVAAAVAEADPAVFAVAELTTAYVDSTASASRQWEDLAGLLSQPKHGGYTIAHRLSTGAGAGATIGTHIFYDPARVEVLKAGGQSGKALAGAAWPSGLTDRHLAWAKVRVRETGSTVWVAAVHLPVDSGKTSYAALRRTLAAKIDGFMDSASKANKKEPIVILGDFNSSFATSPADAPRTLIDRGYTDAAATKSRTNQRYATTHISQQIDNLRIPGYPSTPYKYKYAAPRIDYIFLKRTGGSYSYTNVLHLTSSGKIDKKYQGSDHNLQLASVGLL